MDFVSSVPTTLCSAGLEVLVPKEGMPLPGDTARHYKLRLLPGHFGVLVHRDQQVKKGVAIWIGVIDLHEQEEVGVLLHSGRREEHVWNPGNPLGCLLAILCPTVTVNRHGQPPPNEKGMIRI